MLIYVARWMNKDTCYGRTTFGDDVVADITFLFNNPYVWIEFLKNVRLLVFNIAYWDSYEHHRKHVPPC